MIRQNNPAVRQGINLAARPGRPLSRRLLAALLVLVLAACLPGCTQGQTSTNDHPAFAVQYIRTNGRYEGRKYPFVTVIKTRSELMAYYQANTGFYDLERHEAIASDMTKGFLDAIDRYDDAYFARKSLVLVLLEEGSGSVRHILKDIVLKTGRLEIQIERQIPEIGTADMAEWHVMVELDKATVQDKKIDVVLTDKHLTS
jgi:hypothetical protein